MVSGDQGTLNGFNFKGTFFTSLRMTWIFTCGQFRESKTLTFSATFQVLQQCNFTDSEFVPLVKFTELNPMQNKCGLQ